jgi:hypothetical protein
LEPLFEGFVAAEIIKLQIGRGRSKELYYFRDQQGLEFDIIVPKGNRRLIMMEAKATRTVLPAMAASLSRLSRAISRYRITSFVVHQSTKESPPFSALLPGVKALSLEAFLDNIA